MSTSHDVITRPHAARDDAMIVPTDDVGAPPTVYGELFSRDLDMDRAAQLIARGGRPVLTVVGPGNVGKTRLAIVLAERLRGGYRDGVWFVPLSAERTSAAEFSIRQAIGGVARGSDLVREWVESRESLLILDNLEQIGGVADLAFRLESRLGGSHLIVAVARVLRRRHGGGSSRLN